MLQQYKTKSLEELLEDLKQDVQTACLPEFKDENTPITDAEREDLLKLMQKPGVSFHELWNALPGKAERSRTDWILMKPKFYYKLVEIIKDRKYNSAARASATRESERRAAEAQRKELEDLRASLKAKEDEIARIKKEAEERLQEEQRKLEEESKKRQEEETQRKRHEEFATQLQRQAEELEKLKSAQIKDNTQSASIDTLAQVMQAQMQEQQREFLAKLESDRAAMQKQFDEQNAKIMEQNKTLIRQNEVLNRTIQNLTLDLNESRAALNESRAELQRSQIMNTSLQDALAVVQQESSFSFDHDGFSSNGIDSGAQLANGTPRQRAVSLNSSMAAKRPTFLPPNATPKQQPKLDLSTKEKCREYAKNIIKQDELFKLLDALCEFIANSQNVEADKKRAERLLIDICKNKRNSFQEDVNTHTQSSEDDLLKHYLDQKLVGVHLLNSQHKLTHNRAMLYGQLFNAGVYFPKNSEAEAYFKQQYQELKPKPASTKPAPVSAVELRKQ